MKINRWFIIWASSVLLPGLSRGADPAAGRIVFQQGCTACHSAEPNDNGGARGPSLSGVYGRQAAAIPQFSYSTALKNSHLTWDAATLQRFLAAPTALVPGTSMVVAVPDSADRDALIVYFQEMSRTQKMAAVDAAVNVPDASKQSADWRLDAPGRTHHIEVAALPAPFATSVARNSPQVAPRPAAAALSVPDGFHIAPFFKGLTGPRKMLLAPNGDVFITETTAGRVSLLHLAPGAASATSSVYASGLRQPFGLAFYPDAVHPQWLYVAETDRVIRYAYRVGNPKPHHAAQVVVAALPSGTGHFTRDIAFARDGKRFYVSVGSGSNVAESMSKKTPAEVEAWEAKYGLGAAWDRETNRAAVLVYDTAAPGEAKIYASGIRNCVSLTVQPSSDALWCTTNERDLLGDDLVPDYSTRIDNGQFFGWPWYYIGSNEDPRLQHDRPDLAGKVAVPEVLYQAHSAPLSMTFYAAGSGASAFPSDYVGDAFVAFHGSWNRSLRTGYKLVRVHMQDGKPTNAYSDFVTGFIVDDAHVWGRPVATVQLSDGSLLLSEDGNDVVYRISYEAPRKR